MDIPEWMGPTLAEHPWLAVGVVLASVAALVEVFTKNKLSEAVRGFFALIKERQARKDARESAIIALLKEEITETKLERDLLRERLEIMSAQLTALQVEMEAVKGQVSSLSGLKQALEKEISRLLARNGELREDIHIANKRARAAQSRADTADARDSLDPWPTWTKRDNGEIIGTNPPWHSLTHIDPDDVAEWCAANPRWTDLDDRAIAHGQAHGIETVGRPDNTEIEVFSFKWVFKLGDSTYIRGRCVELLTLLESIPDERMAAYLVTRGHQVELSQ